jgi:4-diphosphocytidyl-2-C-methyl-D-erythritol kinase
MTHVRLFAPAKLNLFLHVTGKRPDGYHLLESLVGFCEFGDTLTIEPSELLSLSIQGTLAEELQADAHHKLVMQAATQLRIRTGCILGAKITLDKQIPISAGLGGGSSDAGAVIEGLSRYWKLWDIAALKHALAVDLGADVPVCVRPQTAFVGGIGEQVTPVSLECEVYVLLVNPNIALPTAQVFRHFKSEYAKPEPMPARRITSFDALIDGLAGKRNMLEEAATEIAPAIADMLYALRSTAGCRMAAMAGSGATCFGLYRTQAELEDAAQQMQRTFLSWWIQPTKLRCP